MSFFSQNTWCRRRWRIETIVIAPGNPRPIKRLTQFRYFLFRFLRIGSVTERQTPFVNFRAFATLGIVETAGVAFHIRYEIPHHALIRWPGVVRWVVGTGVQTFRIDPGFKATFSELHIFPKFGIIGDMLEVGRYEGKGQIAKVKV